MIQNMRYYKSHNGLKRKSMLKEISQKSVSQYHALKTVMNALKKKKEAALTFDKTGMSRS